MSKWFTNFKRNVAAPTRLFAFPFAGGGSAIYRRWPALLPNVEVFAACCPGREARIREPALSRMDALMAELVPEIKPLLDRPYYLFGHSLGALVAFELARELVRCGSPAPNRLYVSAFRAPDRPSTRPILHTLPDHEFIAELKRYGGVPAATFEVEELLKLLLPTLRADFSVFETHVFEAGAPLPTPIQAFYGERDQIVSRGEMVAWEGKTSGAFSLHEVPGDHFFIAGAEQQLVSMIHASIQ